MGQVISILENSPITDISTNKARLAAILPAIRTPNRFEESFDEMAKLFRELNSPIAPSPERRLQIVEEMNVLSDAIKNAPFLFNENKVVAKGFTPIEM